MGKSNSNDSLFIVGIGASAGGLDALSHFCKQLKRSDYPYAIVITQHISPNHHSQLTQILQNSSKWPVNEIEEAVKLKSGIIYVTPPNKHLEIEGDILHLMDYKEDKPVPSVDRFLESLAQQKSSKAIGIILSGTGKDGMHGMQQIKENGGYALVQQPGNASHSGMPKAIIENKAYDRILLAQEMPNEIEHYIDNYSIIKNRSKTETNVDEQIFELLENRTGTDFSKYKPSTLMRRIEKRMHILEVKSKKKYLEYIHKKPKELDELFKTVLIGVTEFFRDKEAFNSLKNYLQKIIDHKSNDKEIRIWSVGTATGEETFTVAILLSEILGDNINKYNVQIFATDIDEKALAKARKGNYSLSSVEKLPRAIVNKYFRRTDSHYEVIKSIRQIVLFSKHDVTTDPPFIRLDLIICRNVLIYFGNALQKEVLPIFHYSLIDDGYLFLGKSENVTPRDELYEKVDSKNKIFQKIPGNYVHSYLSGRLRPKKVNKDDIKIEEKTSLKEKPILEQAKDAFFKNLPYPFVIVNSEKEILEVKGSIRLFAELKEGELTVNILKMINPELSLELRALLAKNEKSNQVEVGRFIRFHVFDKEHFVRFYVYPVDYRQSRKACQLIVFETIAPDTLQTLVGENVAESDSANQQKVIALQHELAASKEHLQLFTEELESSNEELQSLNEELQSTNEELKSSNEELETSNEELQSTNEELQSSNQELRNSNEELIDKEEELTQSKEELAESENLYRSLARNYPNGTINIVARNYTLKFVDGAELLSLGMNSDALLGRNVLSLYEATEATKLKEALDMAFKGDFSQTIIEYQHNSYSASVIPLDKDGNKDFDVLFVTQNISNQINLQKSLQKSLEENEALLKREKQAHQQVTNQERLLHHIFMNAPAAICIIRGKDWIYEFINPIAKRLLGERALVGKAMLEALPELKGSATEENMRKVMETGEPFTGHEVAIEYDREGNGKKVQAYFTFIYQPLYNNHGEIDGIIFYGNDVTDQYLAKTKMREDVERFRGILESLPMMAWTAKPNGEIDYFNKKWYDYTGLTWGSSQGEGWQKVQHPEDLQMVNETLGQVLNEQKSFELEVRYLRASDNAYRWHLNRAVPIKVNGVLKYWIGTAFDIHEQKEIELKKDEFLGVASHELKTPLTALKGYYQLIEESFPTDLEMSQLYLQKFDKSINRINKLVNDLLSISRIESGNFTLDKKNNNLNELVNEVIDHFDGEKQRVQLTGSISSEISFDYDRILQVIENLFSNAVKYSPSDQVIKIVLEEQNDKVHITLIDYGIGISKDELSLLFERYYRVKNKMNASGLGLGLYISQQIIKAHGGNISVKSEDGNGSQFKVTLPKE